MKVHPSLCELFVMVMHDVFIFYMQSSLSINSLYYFTSAMSLVSTIVVKNVTLQLYQEF